MEKRGQGAANRVQVVEVEVGEEVDGVGPFVGGGSPGRGLRDAWGIPFGGALTLTRVWGWGREGCVEGT